jgi:hypothetical protein
METEPGSWLLWVSTQRWPLFIVVTCANALHLFVRGVWKCRRHPELRGGYRKLVLGVLFWGNLPWLVMAVGCLYGGLKAGDYLSPRMARTPMGVAFHVVLLAEWVLGTMWMFRGGAEILIKHPGLLHGDPESPGWIKAVWLLCVTAGLVAVGATYLR